ncbi:DegV domain-containing protein [Glutamicibacter uratoxydans]|uniref:DegV domain-containing protein n=1 Tax=Glutamicibacter uratoxydans TaxID=43667 RepID=A0A4Y4DHJ2_GLUUR|nr:DegV family protein [Glutamicibacter uratoxydans]GED04689.1 DegV domain-containing protein [Glutamicibacter uratoxydans]
MSERAKSPRGGWLPKWLAPRGLSRARIGIVSDSASCLPESLRGSEDFIQLGIPIIVDNDVQGEDVTALMMGLAMGKSVKTSRPAPGEFARAYAQLAAAGCDSIISIHLSAGLSGTADAARLAAADAPVPVAVVDSKTVAMPQGYAIADMLQARAAGAPREMLEQIAAAAAANTVYFAVPSLETLRRGGRISAVSSVFGNLLNVKPILSIVNGAISPIEKPRSFARAQARLVALARRDAEAVQGPARIGVMHFGAAELAAEIATELGPYAHGPVLIESLPAVLAAHTGIGVLGVCVAPLYPQSGPETPPASKS